MKERVAMPVAAGVLDLYEEAVPGTFFEQLRRDLDLSDRRRISICPW